MAYTVTIIKPNEVYPTEFKFKTKKAAMEWAKQWNKAMPTADAKVEKK